MDKEMNKLLIKVREVKNRYEMIWMGLEDVTSVGTGITSKGKPGIIISMEKDNVSIKNIFPPEIEGVQVEIRVSGNIDTDID
jgi:hypothetical protein